MNKIVKPKVSRKGEPSRNPTGKNGFSAGLQPFSKRAEYLGSKFSPQQIIEMADDPNKWKDEKGYLPHWDVVVLKRMAAMISGSLDERAEVSMYLAYKEGKPVERKEVRVIKALSDLTDEELAALAASGAGDDSE